MRRRIVSALVLALMATGVVSVPAVAAPEVDQVSGPVNTAGSAWIGSWNPSVAQLFRPQMSGTLTEVRIPIAKNEGNSQANLTVSILATSQGLPSGTALSSYTLTSSDIAALTRGRANPPSTVSAPLNASVTAGTVYAIRVSTTDADHAYHWFAGNYCLGHVYQSSSSNGAWLTGQGGLGFTAYVDGTPAAASIPKPLAAGASPGYRSATLSFNICGATGSETPAALGITNYEYSLDAGANWQALSPADATSPVTVRGLSNGVSYSIRLRAVTSSGSGPASDPFSVVPAGQAPPTTSITSALNTAGGGLISVTEDVGEYVDAGEELPILSYEYDVDWSDGWTPAEPGTSSPVLITGLADGYGFWIRLRPVRANGPGLPSNAVRVEPGKPDAPAGLVATPVDGGVSIVFTPCYEGAAPITGLLKDTEQQGDRQRVVVDDISLWEPLVISGLTNGVPVVLMLRAVNEYGDGPDSDALTVTPGAGQPVVTGSTTTCSRPGPTRPVSNPPSSGGSGSAAPQSSVQVVSEQPVITAPAQTPSTPSSTSAAPTTQPEEPPSVVRVTKPAAATPALAPVVKVSVSEPIQVQVSGLPASTRMTVQRWLNGRWQSVGAVTSGPAGGVKTPEMTAKKPGAFMVRIGSAKAGWKFVRVVAE